MNSDTPDSLAKLLRTEDAPPLGAGTLPAADDRFFSGLAHLFAIVIWPWKRAASPAVDAHGKEALNMAITWLAVLLPLQFAGALLPLSLLRIVSLAVSLLSLAALALAACGFVLARRGKLLRYPCNLRLIK